MSRPKPNREMQRACDLLGSVAAMARALDVYPSAVHGWIKGERKVPLERCPQVERLTGGEVRCEALRPDKAEYFEYLRGVASEPEAA